MKKKPAQRTVYDSKYYLTRWLLKDPEFLKVVRDLKNEFAKWGCPIPKDGVKNQTGYYAWHKKLWAKYSEVRRSKKYDDALRTITGGADKISMEQAHQLRELEETALPPVVYGYAVDEILDEFNLDSKNRDDQDWMDLLIFYNRTEYPKKLAELKFTPPLKGKEPELWVRYFGHTRPSDITAKSVHDFQKLLPGYRVRNKPKDLLILKRDDEVIRMYHAEIKATREAGRRRVAGDSAATAVEKTLKKKYPELNKILIQKIVSRSEADM